MLMLIAKAAGMPGSAMRAEINWGTGNSDSTGQLIAWVKQNDYAPRCMIICPSKWKEV
jgi:hypothetical protein